MKNLIFLIVTILSISVQQSLSQTEKGNLFWGGTAGLDLNLEKGVDEFSIALNPDVGVFVMDKLAVGGNVGFTFYKLDDTKLTTLNVLPLVRYYSTSAAERSLFFLEGKAGLALATTDIFGESDTETAFQFSAGPGVAFFISDCMALEGLLTYNHITGNLERKNVGLTVGLQVYLNGDE